MNFNSIVKHIESLPALSDTTQIVRRLYQDGGENVDVNKLIIAIENDALLTANILKMINAPFYGLSKQISSVSQAVTLFGTQLIYGLVVRYSIESLVIANLRPYCITNSKFNDICQMQSALVYQWYAQIDVKNAQYLAPLALIMESGKLVVSQEIVKKSNIKEFNKGIKEAEEIKEYEDSVFGTSSYYVSGLLFEHWNLDANYVNLLKGLDYEYDGASKIAYFVDILDIVKTAVNVKNIFTQKSISDAAEIVADIGLNVDDFMEVCEHIHQNYLQSQHS